MISKMKTTAIRHSNIYGPFDKYDLQEPCLGATITKVMKAKKDITVWGSGDEKRDVLYVDDNEFCKFMHKKQPKQYRLYNCGSGKHL